MEAAETPSLEVEEERPERRLEERRFSSLREEGTLAESTPTPKTFEAEELFFRMPLPPSLDLQVPTSISSSSISSSSSGVRTGTALCASASFGLKVVASRIGAEISGRLEEAEAEAALETFLLFFLVTSPSEEARCI